MIKLSPCCNYYSSRAACYNNVGQYDKALADAKKAVELKPDWSRGYTRAGLSCYNFGAFSEAKDYLGTFGTRVA